MRNCTRSERSKEWSGRSMAARNDGTSSSSRLRLAACLNTNFCACSINNLRTRYQRDHPEGLFSEPERYGEPHLPVTTIINSRPRRTPPLPPTWWQLKADFGVDWVWDACTRALGGQYCVKDKMAYLGCTPWSLRAEISSSARSPVAVIAINEPTPGSSTPRRTGSND